MLLIFYIAFILAALLIKRSWLIGIGLAIFLWILFGWSSGNADYLLYVSRFNNIETRRDSLEFLYGQVMTFVKNNGWTYQDYLVGFSFVFITCLLIFISKLSRNWLLVLGLYAVYPFMVDVVQTRNSMALVCIWFAFYQILNYKTWKQTLLALLSIFIASQFHSSAFVFLVILLIPYLTNHLIMTLSMVTAVIGVVIVPFMGGTLASLAQSFNVQERLEGYSSLTAAGYQLDTRKLLIIATMFITYVGVIQLIKMIPALKENVDHTVLDRVEKMNFLLLIIVPLVGFMPDIYRSYSALSIVNYALWGQAMSPREFGLTMHKHEYWLRQLVFLIAFINIYLLVLSSINIDTVFRPLFDNNRFWSEF